MSSRRARLPPLRTTKVLPGGERSLPAINRGATLTAPNGSASSGATGESRLGRAADRLRGGPDSPSGAGRHVAGGGAGTLDAYSSRG
jgi:hypothetical protein